MRKLIIATMLALLPIGASAQTFTEDEIKELALQAILENPQIIVEAMTIL